MTTSRHSASALAKATPSSDDDDHVPESLAERRALHNSVERSRREALNAKFSHLAQVMPSLSHIHRPSKSVIISHCLDMVSELKDTKAENDRLQKHINQMRFELLANSQNKMSNSIDSGHTPSLISSNLSGRSPSPRTAYAMSNDLDRPRSRPISFRHSVSGPSAYGQMCYKGSPLMAPQRYTSSSLSQVSFQDIDYQEPVDPRLIALHNMQAERSNSTDSISPSGPDELDGSFFSPDFARPLDHDPFALDFPAGSVDPSMSLIY